MRLIERARAIGEQGLRRVEERMREAGLRVERRGGVVRARTSRRRWLEDARLRFLAVGR